MAKNTSILLGDYFDNFISRQVESGKFTSASEVVRAALRVFEFEETKRTELISELKKGERSGFVDNFDRDSLVGSMSDEIHSQNEIDERVIAQADDDAAWEAPIRVNGGMRNLAFSESNSVVLPKSLLDQVRKLASGGGVTVDQFVTSAVTEKVSISEGVEH